MNNKYGIIYSALNTINNKRYIGQTIRGLDKRKKEHIKQSQSENGYLIHRAIRKHGTEVFEWSIIDTASNSIELDEKELYWIKYYSAYGENGYNMTVGGQFNKRTEDNADEISAMYGGRKFLVFDTKGHYLRSAFSQTEFAKELGVHVTTVNNTLLGIRKSTKDKILIFEEEFTKERLNQIVQEVYEWHKYFAVFDWDKNLVGMWNNKTTCSEDIGIGRQTLGDHLVNTDHANKGRKFHVYYVENVPSELRDKLRE